VFQTHPDARTSQHRYEYRTAIQASKEASSSEQWRSYEGPLRRRNQSGEENGQTRWWKYELDRQCGRREYYTQPQERRLEVGVSCQAAWDALRLTKQRDTTQLAPTRQQAYLLYRWLLTPARPTPAFEHGLSKRARWLEFESLINMILHLTDWDAIVPLFLRIAVLSLRGHLVEFYLAHHDCPLFWVVRDD
jgi:hypothetical protein